MAKKKPKKQKNAVVTEQGSDGGVDGPNDSSALRSGSTHVDGGQEKLFIRLTIPQRNSAVTTSPSETPKNSPSELGNQIQIDNEENQGVEEERDRHVFGEEESENTFDFESPPTPGWQQDMKDRGYGYDIEQLEGKLTDLDVTDEGSEWGGIEDYTLSSSPLRFSPMKSSTKRKVLRERSDSDEHGSPTPSKRAIVTMTSEDSEGSVNPKKSIRQLKKGPHRPLTDSELEMEDEASTPKVVQSKQRKRIGRPPKLPPPQPNYISIQFWIVVLLLPKPVVEPAGARRKGRGSGSAAQAKGPETKMLGPSNLSDKMSWEDLLDELVKETKTDRARIEKVVPTMKWCQSTPAGARGKSELPLHNQRSFETLILWIQANSQKKASSLPIWISINQPPSITETENDTFSWNADTRTEQKDLWASNPVHDKLETLLGKKIAIDDTLQPYKDEIFNKYPMDTCAQHPGIRCFVYVPKNWHFHLDDNRAGVWGYEILRGNTDFNVPPLENKFFKPDQVIKEPRHNQVYTPPPPPAYNVPAPTTPHLQPYPGYPSIWPPPQPFNQFPYTPPYPFPTTPINAAVHPPVANPRSRSPDIPAIGDLFTWLKNDIRVNPPEVFLTALETLHFQVGDDVSVLSAQYVKEVTGLEELEWARFTKAYIRYLKRFEN